jgi:hypothetical protein
MRAGGCAAPGRCLVLGGLLLAAAAQAACIETLEAPSDAEGSMLVGESRVFELRYLRFDVSNYEQTLTREDLLALPEDTQRRLWLLDLDLSNSPGSPRFIENALTSIRDADPASLEPAARNMQSLLNMTPDTADLSGTSFEALIALAPLIGVSPARALADLSGANVEDRFLPTDAIAETLLDNVIATHPAAVTRLGPRTAENPGGVYAVSPRSLPITLADAASDFATFSALFGETRDSGVYHPGFVTGGVSASILGDDFSLRVRANANALPYKGVDLSAGEPASVNSISSQINSLFNFDDPNWLVIDGLVPGTPVINEITFRIVEDEAFHAGGRSPLPRPQGSSDAWFLAPWTLERVILDSSLKAFDGLTSRSEYFLPGEETPIFSIDVLDGWTTVETRGGVGSPPPPAYVWDILLEISQVRIHDGGIAEGDANALFTLRDVPVGIDTRTIERTIRENLEADPFALIDIAEEIIDTTRGDADFYYVRGAAADGVEADWLFFVSPSDIRQDEAGLPVREYSYANPGFFADAGLTQRVSTTDAVASDVTHEKVALLVGQTVFMEDDEGLRYALTLEERRGRSTVALRVERVQ